VLPLLEQDLIIVMVSSYFYFIVFDYFVDDDMNHNWVLLAANGG
jgi:hypothetical protein